jgi:hypothetical protein
MNFQLGGAEEWVDGALAGRLGDLLIRCNNVCVWAAQRPAHPLLRFPQQPPHTFAPPPPPPPFLLSHARARTLSSHRSLYVRELIGGGGGGGGGGGME